MKKCFILAVILLAISEFPLFAGYNNYQYLIGERSAGMGTACVGIVNDSTGLWYNPAGLSKITSNTLNISGNTYSYKDSKVDGYIEGLEDTGEYKKIDKDSSDFSIVANSLIFGKKTGNYGSWGFGIFVPYAEDATTTFDAKITGPDYAWRYQSELKDKYNYYVGLAGWGAKISDNLSLGISLGAGYLSETTTGTTCFYLDNYIDWAYTSVDFNKTTTSLYTAQAGVGLQYNINENNSVGLYIQSPAYALYGNIKSINNSYYAQTSSYEDSNTLPGETETVKVDAFEKELPGRFVIGYGYTSPESWTVSFDIVCISPLGDTQDTVVNYCIGFEKYIGESYIIRLGGFTDFSQEKGEVTEEAESLDTKIDYYGGTLSFSTGTQFTVIENDVTENKKLWSTFGLIYRRGSGDRTTYRYDDPTVAPSFLVKKATEQEIGVFISESLSF